MDIYSLYRNFWDFAFENPEKIKPNHIAIFCFAIEHCNRLGWKKKFGFPSAMTMDAIGIKSYNTYINALNELVDMGFIKMIEKSKNQYSSNIIALSENIKAHDKALDKAIGKHTTKQSESTIQSTGESISSIDKPLNKETSKPLNKETKKLPLSKINILDVEDGLKQYFEIALAFQKLFIKNLKENDSPVSHQINAKFLSYVTPIRLMFENDGVKIEQLQSVFKYLDSPQGDFWKSNILSTKKLREKFSQLVIKSKETQNANRNNSNKYGNSASVQGTFNEIDKMFGDK